MSTSTKTWPLLDVKIYLPSNKNPYDTTLTIGFSEAKHAQRYHEWIRRTPLYKELMLDGERRGNTVSMRLPAHFHTLSASKTTLGFCLTVDSPDFAKRWVDAMECWSSIPGTRGTHLYVRRNWTEFPRLETILLSDPEPPQPRQAQTYQNPG